MKTILNPTNQTEIIKRIDLINEFTAPLWGQMNPVQMLKHCILCEKMYLGQKKYPRSFLGRLIGKWALNGILKDDRALGKNAPTNARFKITETTGDVELLKKQWIALIESYNSLSENPLNHWFFGTMTREQVGFFVYKHADHHLRQFNA